MVRYDTATAVQIMRSRGRPLKRQQVSGMGVAANGQPISEALINQAIADYDVELPHEALRGNSASALAAWRPTGHCTKKPERASDVMDHVHTLCNTSGYSTAHVNIVCVAAS